MHGFHLELVNCIINRPIFGYLGLLESLELDMHITNEVWLAAIFAKKNLSNSTPCVPKFGSLGLSGSLYLYMRIINEV